MLSTMVLPLHVFLLLHLFTNNVHCILYPQDSETRSIKYLDGIWNFRPTPILDQEKGFREKWFTSAFEQSDNEDIVAMPVPSSYNDITQNASIRNHVGWVWYDRTFFVPKEWQLQMPRIVLRFGSVHYFCIAWINGFEVMSHAGGHLPFEAEVGRFLKFNEKNLVTVAVNNTLTNDTIPQGCVLQEPEPVYLDQDYTFDFFNYAGIHRSVILYTTPDIFIDDITISTAILNSSIGLVTYSSKITGDNNRKIFAIELYDKEENCVAKSNGTTGKLLVKNLKIWWPYNMHPNPGYLYKLTVKILEDNKLVDVYRLNVGIRSVSWSADSFLINGQNFYIRGFGKHEDTDIRGKGVDLPSIIKDFNLIKWIGANSFRTSHYPYAEEILDRADCEGIVVIDETPAVNLDIFGSKLLENHLRVIKELYERDKNRPSVIMWSLGNEPRSQKKEALPYFKRIVEEMKSLDKSRPVTVILNRGLGKDNAAPFLDIIGLNRYFGWYVNPGLIELIKKSVLGEYAAWHKLYRKPIFISEYGAGAISGFHSDPAEMFTEDYATSLMLEHFKAFDALRLQNFFIGEMIWNFADFATKQTTKRAQGNKKGLFTRNRQPKHTAHLLRVRYWQLANSIDNCCNIPRDIIIDEYRRNESQSFCKI